MEMLLFIGYVDLSIIYIILLLVGMVVCFAFAPVEDKNKPLDRDEISVFKKRAYLILSIEFFIWLAVSVIFQPVEKTMDYEDYYYESRSRYYDACSEVNNYENRANELRSQRQRKNYISISSNQI